MMEQQKAKPHKQEETNVAIMEGAGNIVPGAIRGATRRSAEENKAKIRKLMEEESKMVKGKFIYHECPGGHVDVFQRKYKDLPAFKQTFVDGMEYTVPLWVARWLNGVDKAAGAYEGVINSGAWPIYKHETVEQWGKSLNLQPIGTWKRRFSFQSMDFIT